MNQSEFFNSLDYFYIGFTFLSCMVGFFRGFVKDFFSTCAWFGSGFLTACVSPYLSVILYDYFKHELLAKIAAVSFSYIFILICLLLIINACSGKIKNSVLSGIDRALGTLFGFVRGILILVAGILIGLFFNIIDERNAIVVESKITPTFFAIAKPLMPKLIWHAEQQKKEQEQQAKVAHKPKKIKNTNKRKLSNANESFVDKCKDYLSNLIAKYKERNEVQKHIESIRQRKSPKSDKAMRTLMHPKPNKPDRNKIETKKK